MTKRDNILQELKDLNSPLAANQPQDVYSVPAGYFEELAAKVLNRIKANAATNPADELAFLSPLLSSLSKKTPYTVPAGYFDDLGQHIQYAINSSEQDAGQETESISPLLAGLKKENPYRIPQGYFENLASDIAAKETATETKVISITRRSWFRYAAAAVVTGIIILAGFIIFDKGGNDKNGGQVLANVLKDIKKLNDTQKDDLLDFLDAGMNGTETAQVNTDNKSKEIQQLLQDISEEELKDFQQQSEDVEEVLMTN